MPSKRSKDTGRWTPYDPLLPMLDKPDPVTIFDLSPEDRANVEIYQSFGHTNKWRYKEGYSPSGQ